MNSEKHFFCGKRGDLSLADIAAVTGVPEETAKSRLRYAVKKTKTVATRSGCLAMNEPRDDRDLQDMLDGSSPLSTPVSCCSCR